MMRTFVKEGEGLFELCEVTVRESRSCAGPESDEVPALCSVRPIGVTIWVLSEGHAHLQTGAPRESVLVRGCGARHEKERERTS